MDPKWMKPDIYCFELHSFIRNIENVPESSQISK